MFSLCLSNALQSALESGYEARIVQIDFNAALMVSTMREFSIRYALCVLEFLSNHSPHVMVDGCRSILVDDLSGVPPASVLGPLPFTYTSTLFSVLKNKLIGYSNDSA